MIVDACRSLRAEKVRIICPTFQMIYRQWNPKTWLKPVLHFLRYKMQAPNLISSCSYVEDEQLPYYYGAADIVLVPRKEILNSGSLPLGFLMHKVVVGPNVGNVGEILQETGNVVFDAENSTATLPVSLREAFTFSQQGKGEENYQYAMQNWGTDRIAAQVYEEYRELCHQ